MERSRASADDTARGAPGIVRAARPSARPPGAASCVSPGAPQPDGGVPSTFMNAVPSLRILFGGYGRSRQTEVRESGGTYEAGDVVHLATKVRAKLIVLRSCKIQHVCRELLREAAMKLVPIDHESSAVQFE